MRFIHQTISIHYVNQLLSAARQRGLKSDQLLERAAIRRSTTDSEMARVTPQQFARFILTIWQQLDDEFMGMGVGRARFGLFMLMARHCIHLDNLAAVFEYLGTFYSLTGGDTLRLSLEKGESEVRLVQSTNGSTPEFEIMLNEFFLMVWHRFASWLVAKRLPILLLEFSYSETKHRDEYRLMFPGEVRFDQPRTALVFSADLLQLPVVQDRKSLEAYFRRLPLEWFIKQAYQATYTKRAYEFLRTQGLAEADMESLAQYLNITSRTLRRKLDQEGTSFQQLKDRLRLDMAINMLMQPDLPIAQISNRLGFSDPAAFSRAFKHWTGLAPASYRRI